MADNAAQSPYISSSHGAGGEPSSRPAATPHCDAPCAEGKTSLFSDHMCLDMHTISSSSLDYLLPLASTVKPPDTSTISARDEELESRLVLGEERDCMNKVDISCWTSADSGTKIVSSGMLGLESFTKGVDAHLYNPFIPNHSLENNQANCGHVVFFEKDGKTESIRNHDLMYPTTDSAALEADQCALTEGKQSKDKQISTKPLEAMSPDGESPDSPFEVITDKTVFEQEFQGFLGDLNDTGSSLKHSETEWLTDSIHYSHSREVQLRTQSDGSVPASAELHASPPPYSATVYQDQLGSASGMENISSDLLSNWDFIPKIEREAVKTLNTVCESLRSDIAVSGPENKMADCQVSINIQESLWHPRDCSSSTSIKEVDEWADISQIYASQKAASVAMEFNMSVNEADVGDPCVSMQNLDTFTNASGVPFEDTPLEDKSLGTKSLPETCKMKDLNEADSSGESDDTVIEDSTTYLAFENKKIEKELHMTFNNVSGSVKPASVITVGEIGNDWIREDEPNGLSKLNERDGQLYKISEDQVLEFETVPGPLNVFAKSPVNEAETFIVTSTLSKDANIMCSSYEDVIDKLLVRETSNFSPTGVKAMKLNKTIREIDPFLAFSNTVEPKQGGELHGENFMDFMKECMTLMKDKTPDSLKKTTTGERQYEADSEACKGSETSMEGDIGTAEIGDKVALGREFNTQLERAQLDLEQEQQTIRALKEVSMSLDNKIPGEESEGSSAKDITLKEFETESVLVVQRSFWPDRLAWTQETSELPPCLGIGASLPVVEELLVPKETTWEDTSSEAMPTLDHDLARLLTTSSVRDLIFWRDVKKTGAVFGTSLIVLLSLAAFSVISVIAYLILAVLSVTIVFRIYRSVVQAVQKSEEGHPFKSLLDMDVTMSSETFHKHVNDSLVHVNKILKVVVRLFLVEDLVDSLKLAVFMWLMTYVGAVFNGITLLILVEILAFSLPVVYEKYQTQIDHYIVLVRDQTKSIIAKVQAKVPGIGKKKAE
uniref:Reticulon n=1 Tax=Geotrypetes seraphini TaxID=260995 RepID=A0A6P8RYX0_GEOSA|nr:reticulon-3 isoform X2 [Geotrypetes seraphini]